MRRLSVVSDQMPTGFDDLELESIVAGHTMLSKLKRNWPAAFPPHASLLVAVEDGPMLLGIGGIAPDPYDVEPGRGRIRHLYVAHAARRLGVGRRILNSCLDFARSRFHTVSLRTPASEQANRFYEAHGFRPLHGHANASHVLYLPRQP